MTGTLKSGEKFDTWMRFTEGYRKTIAKSGLQGYIASAGANGALMLYPKEIVNYRDCRIEPAGGKTRISQMVEVRGPLGGVLGGMLGPQVAKDFGVLLGNLAKKAESA